MSIAKKTVALLSIFTFFLALLIVFGSFVYKASRYYTTSGPFLSSDERTNRECAQKFAGWDADTSQPLHTTEWKNYLISVCTTEKIYGRSLSEYESWYVGTFFFSPWKDFFMQLLCPGVMLIPAVIAFKSLTKRKNATSTTT